MTDGRDQGNMGTNDDGGLTTGGDAREEMAQAQAQTPGGDGSMATSDVTPPSGALPATDDLLDADPE